jgi:hypothetical protein
MKTGEKMKSPFRPTEEEGSNGAKNDNNNKLRKSRRSQEWNKFK